MKLQKNTIKFISNNHEIIINKEEKVNYLFLYYPKCSTCQKAKKWLQTNDIKFVERDIIEKNPTIEELKKWHKMSGFPLKKFFNTSGLVYKELQLKDKLTSMTEEQQYTLLASNGKLIKRPLIIKDTTILIGFKEKDWEQLKKSD